MPVFADQKVVAQARAWRQADPDPRTRAQLDDLLAAGDHGALAALFGHRLSFGTAGLRATVGPGPAHINRLVVRQSVFGIATYALGAAGGALGGGVVVGFDGRTDSAMFADDVVGTLAAMGIGVRAFVGPVPTPLVGFAVRRLGAALGIVITASHNPPDYNGIKVYWADGVQLVPPHDQGAQAAIAQGAGAHLGPPWLAAAARRDVAPVDAALEAAYLAAIQPTWSPRPPRPPDFGVAYSPLHGVGLPWVVRGLELAGFRAPHVVAAQAAPDGAFPTLRAPNPEEPESMRQVTQLAAARGLQLALATDPDADRLAAAAPTASGWRQLTGDELGALLADALMPTAAPAAVFASSLVSAPLVGRMARAAGHAHFVTPTGFKWLAQGMRQVHAGGGVPTLAYEEALGFAIGEAVWDKDGVAALVALVAAAHAWQQQGQSVWDRLAGLAARHGLVVSCQRTATGAAAERLAGARLRAAPPGRLAGRRVIAMRDLMASPWQAPELDVVYPPADTLIFDLGPAEEEGDAALPGAAGEVRVIVRPSGTEPKVKCYYILSAPPPPPAGFVAADRAARQALARLAACHLADT